MFYKRHRVPTLLALLLAFGCSPRPEPTAGGPRIISLAPNLTEMVCAVGGADTLVGRTSACNYPPDIVGRVPVVGGFGTPSMETLIALKPTAILDVDLEDESLAARIDALGLSRHRIACRSLDDIPGAVRAIGILACRTNEAGALAARLETEIAGLRALPAPTRRPSVFVEIWSDPLMTAGPNTFISDLIWLAGGSNICDQARDYLQVSAEWVIKRDPDIILCLAMSDAGSPRDRVMQRAGWQTIRAVKTGRVHDQVNIDVLTRPGPRVMEGIEALRACIAAEGSLP